MPETERGRVWREHMEGIMNVENNWDHTTEAEKVKETIERIKKEEVAKALLMVML